MRSGTAVNVVLINGQYQPTISLAANRWYRWRTVFAAVDAVLEPMLTGCELKLLAKDGIYLHQAPRDVTLGFLGPGNRADLLVRCAAAGTYAFMSNAIRRRQLQRGGGGGGLAGGGAGNAAFEQLLATVVVSEQVCTHVRLPGTFGILELVAAAPIVPNAS